jgi:osmotically inducible protein OsmC
MSVRIGRAEWAGDLQSGKGELVVGPETWTARYSFASRFAEGTGTSPEELIAAAHAACFSMALCHVLAAGFTPSRIIRTGARVHFRNIDGLPTIQSIDLETEVEAPGLGAEQLAAAAEKARAGCTISRALAGVREITVRAQLMG